MRLTADPRGNLLVLLFLRYPALHFGLQQLGLTRREVQPAGAD